MAAALAAPLAELVAVAPEAPFGLPWRTIHRRGRGLVVFDDARDLPALGPAHHVTDDDRALQRSFAAGLAQAGDVQKHIPQIGLVRIVRNDEAIALGRVEPLHTPRDPHGFLVRILPLKIVT